MKRNECNFDNPGFLYEFGFHKVTLWHSGTWPLDTKKISMMIRFAFSVTMQVLTLTQGVIEVSFNCRDAFSTMVEYIVMMSFCVVSCSKQIICRRNRLKMYKTCAAAADDWAFSNSPENRKMMWEQAKVGRFLYFFQVWNVYIITTTYFAIPLMVKLASNKYMLPLDLLCIETYVVHDLNSWKWGLMYISQVLQGMVIASGNVAHDVFYVSILLHICAQVQIVTNDFKKLGNASNGADFKVNASRHRYLLEVVENMQHIFSLIILIQFMVGVILLCILGIQLLWIFKYNYYAGLSKNLESLIFTLFEVYLYCWAGDKLMSSFDEIPKAIFSSRWYNLKPTSVKDISFALMKANLSAKLRAGQMVEVNHSSFMELMRKMLSTFSVLRVMLFKV